MCSDIKAYSTVIADPSGSISFVTASTGCNTSSLLLQSLSLLNVNVSVAVHAVRSQLHLTKINFDVSRREKTPMFVGREWLFRDMEAVSSILNFFAKTSLLHMRCIIIRIPTDLLLAVGLTCSNLKWDNFGENGPVKEKTVCVYLSDCSRGC